MIFPYNRFSKSARELAVRLKVSRVSTPVPGTTVINWGNGPAKVPAGASKANFINEPEHVGVCTNKRTFFLKMRDRGAGFMPPFWLTPEIPPEVFPVVCRQKLTGHSGEGIVIADTPEDLVPAPLYVKYIPKTAEYRVHCVREAAPEAPSFRAFCVQKKLRQHSCEEPNWKVRNHANGFIYSRNFEPSPADGLVVEAALSVFKETGLDFGAVDVVFSTKKGPFILEINTAPGLEGETIQDYVTVLSRFLKERST